MEQKIIDIDNVKKYFLDYFSDEPNNKHYFRSRWCSQY